MDWLSFFRKKKGQKDTIRECFCFVFYQKKSYPVRVIAAKLPKEKAEQARKRKQRKRNSETVFDREKTSKKQSK